MDPTEELSSPEAGSDNLAAEALAAMTPEQLSAPIDPDVGEELTSKPASAGPVSTPTDPNAAVGAARPAAATQPAAAAAPATPSLRTLAQGLGYDLSGYEDETSAALALISAANQGRQLLPFAQSVAPHYREFQDFLAQRAAAAKPQAAPERPAWAPPEFDERWLSYVDRNAETGLFQPKAGVGLVPPEVVGRVQAYADWNEKFRRDPMSVIEPAIEQKATQIAQKIVAAQVGLAQQQSTVGQILEQNAPWLYQVDEAGNRYVDASGKFLPTPHGASYLAKVATLSRAGMRDPKQVDQIARQLVYGEALAQQQGTTPSAQTQSPAPAAVVRPGVVPAPARKSPAVAAVSQPVPPSRAMSLYEMMQADIASQGLTGESLHAELFGG